jgi:hypothetical protein
VQLNIVICDRTHELVVDSTREQSPG